jgi:hypothetical protein
MLVILSRPAPQPAPADSAVALPTTTAFTWIVRAPEPSGDPTPRPIPLSLDAIGQFVMDIGGSHHRFFAFGTRSIGDSVEEPPPGFIKELAVVFTGAPAAALWRNLRYSGVHSIASFAWNSEDILLPPLFHILWGFRVFFQISTSVF